MLRLRKDPVKVPSGHIFDRSTIQRIILDSGVNPINRDPLSGEPRLPLYTRRTTPPLVSPRRASTVCVRAALRPCAGALGLTLDLLCQWKTWCQTLS